MFGDGVRLTPSIRQDRESGKPALLFEIRTDPPRSYEDQCSFLTQYLARVHRPANAPSPTLFWDAQSPPLDPVEYCRAAYKLAVLKQPLQGHVAWHTAAGRAYYAVWLAELPPRFVPRHPTNLPKANGPPDSEARKSLYPTEAPPRFELGVEVLQFYRSLCSVLHLLLSRCHSYPLARTSLTGGSPSCSPKIRGRPAGRPEPPSQTTDATE